MKTAVWNGRSFSASCGEVQRKDTNELHYGENYAEALAILGHVLEEHPTNLEALTLQADIFVHQGEYQRAEPLARQVVSADEKYVDAWKVLANIYETQQDWKHLLVAAERGLAAADSDWTGEHLLEQRARANLELANFADLKTDLEALSHLSGPVTRRRALGTVSLRALMLLRNGQYDEALQLARQYDDELRLDEIGNAPRAVFIAVRFEAAHKLGRPAEGGELSVNVRGYLRRLNFGNWVDRLVAEYSLQDV